VERAIEEEASPDTIAGVVGQDASGRFVFRTFAWSVAGVAIAAAAVAALQPVFFPPTLESKAEKLLSLPKGAKISKVTFKDAEEGDVWFKVPGVASPEQELKDIWTTNGYLGYTPPVATVPPATTTVGTTTTTVTALPGRSVPHRFGVPAIIGPAAKPVKYRLTTEPFFWAKATLEYDPKTQVYHFSKEDPAYAR